MRRWGINRRMLVLALLPGGLIGLVLYAYFMQGQLSLLDQSLNDRGVTIVQQLAPASEFGVITGNKELLTRLATSILREQEVIGIGIVDRERHPLVSVGEMPLHGMAAWKTDSPNSLCDSSANSLLFCAPIYRTRLEVDDFPLANRAPPAP